MYFHDFLRHISLYLVIDLELDFEDETKMQRPATTRPVVNVTHSLPRQTAIPDITITTATPGGTLLDGTGADRLVGNI